MNHNPFSKLIGIEEAAIFANLSIRHMRLLLSSGRIRGRKIGRDWITTEDEVKKYLLTNPKPGPKPN
jgi:hypothetical protein